MTSSQGQPEYLPQGVSYLGFLSKELGDLRGITTLAHELMQNADDAKDDSGELAATRITFDISDDALVVSNDAVFREIDFDRLRDVASGTKRSESGARTTGAFGVGFISVYQVTDHPEILSASLHWILRPEEPEERRVAQYQDESITRDKGTLFRLPWAFQKSEVREKLRVLPIMQQNLTSFTQELKEALPRAVLFLKKLEIIELKRNGKTVSTVRRIAEGNDVLIDCDGISGVWKIFQGNFSSEAARLRTQYGAYIEDNRIDTVSVAIPNSPLEDGLLFATLPTEEQTGLPFHINADFFPDSDRKHIVFGSELDPRSEWNRAAVRAAAAAFGAHLQGLLRMFEKDHRTFWFILERLYKAHQEQDSNTRKPFGEFWRRIQGSLKTLPVVFTQSGEWRIPSAVRLPPGSEEAAVQTFNALGIDTVHQDLRSSWNILANIEVQRITPKDFYDALARRKMVERSAEVSALPEVYRTRDGLEKLWEATRALLDNRNVHVAAEAKRTLASCSLAPCTDGQLWPFKSAYRARAETRELFSKLVPQVPFLTSIEGGEALAEKLCPEFMAADAVAALSELSAEALESAWQSSVLDPARLLRWFQEHTVGISADSKLRAQLASLPVFPSGGKLRPLTKLALPGNFVDPLGLSELVDVERLPRLGDFLQDLGARELTFAEYAARYIPGSLSRNDVTLEKKRKLVTLLAQHIGEIRDDAATKRALATTAIIECEDGNFRQPHEVYFKTKEMQGILGSLAQYARLPEAGAEGVTELYRWLGVSGQPRPEQLTRIITELTSNAPQQRARDIVTRILEALGRAWDGLPDTVKAKYEALRSTKWLPTEGDHSTWYRPTELYASYNKNLFESQARFLDAPTKFQQSSRPFLEFLGVNLAPKAFQVVRHLLKRVEEDIDPPAGIYAWLDNTASPAELAQLKDQPCLRLGGKYFRPDQVFWGQHPFGRFRRSLGAEFQQYGRLLDALGIRQTPDYTDALKVLKEVSQAAGNSPLPDEEREVMLRCWVMISEALQREEISGDALQAELDIVKCVPNRKGLLHQPSWMFFEDRFGLAEKFPDLLTNNTIPRPEGVWQAMAAAGVKPISEAVRGELVEVIAPGECDWLKQRVVHRMPLIKRICEGLSRNASSEARAIPLLYMRADELRVVWHLTAFDRNRTSAPEPVSAQLDRANRTLYFTMDGNSLPWSALARELAQAIAPGVESRSISPGISIVLEANTEQEASEKLNDLGIAPVQELSIASGNGAIAERFDEGPQPEEVEYEPAIPTNTAPSEQDGHIEEIQAVEDEEPSGMDEETEPTLHLMEAGKDGLEGLQTPFVRKLLDVQTATPSSGNESPVLFPSGGPRTEESAKRHTEESFRFGREGSQVHKTVMRWEPRPAAKGLADEFRRMVKGDYTNRCQICSRTFKTRNNDSQVFVIHMVEPSADLRTNHFGNLVSLCGWHSALVQYGQWAFIDPETDSSINETERLKQVILDAPRKVDEHGNENEYVSMVIRFWNVYQDWNAAPVAVKEEIRYSLPHWKYLRELIAAEGV